MCDEGVGALELGATVPYVREYVNPESRPGRPDETRRALVSGLSESAWTMEAVGPEGACGASEQGGIKGEGALSSCKQTPAF